VSGPRSFFGDDVLAGAAADCGRRRQPPGFALAAGSRLVGGIVNVAPPGRSCRAVDRPAPSALLDKLVRRIYPLYPDDEAQSITVELIHGDAVDAFATLGGHIYIFEGLIAQASSPEELAGVLAHEVEHVRNRHIVQALEVNLFTLIGLEAALPSGGQADPRMVHPFLSLQFSSQQESEADELGLERLRSAHVDAGGFAQFFERARSMPAPPSILSNHPSNQSSEAPAASFVGYPARPVLDAGEWQTLRTIGR
jgi:beta-barrel assembly-enhancing protease